MMNQERMIVRIIREICNEESIDLASFSHDWILRLKKGNCTGFIYGYNFSVNNSSSARICDDKSAAYDILAHSGIPAVEHMFFMDSENLHYIGGDGNWEQMMKLLDEHGVLVCKANAGTGGNDIFLIKTQLQLENAVHSIFRRYQSIAISPYYDILKEYRVIVLNGEVKLAYAKNIPFVAGDGKKDLRKLILDYMSANQQLVNLDIDDQTLNMVLSEGEVWNVHWKSNLGQGAKPELIKDKKLLSELSSLALKAAEALLIDFASIDIVDIPDGRKVLEVNCGIMLENFIAFSPNHYHIAKNIYREALLQTMHLDL